MKLRTYLADNFGGIKEALGSYSQVAAVIYAQDQRIGKRGAFGKRGTKSPFRGIASASPRKPKDQRRIDGVRDESPTWRRRGTDLAELAFRNPNPTPVAFLQ